MSFDQFQSSSSHAAAQLIKAVVTAEVEAEVHAAMEATTAAVENKFAQRTWKIYTKI